MSARLLRDPLDHKHIVSLPKRLTLFPWYRIGTLFLLLLLGLLLGANSVSSSSIVIPTISITSVVTDDSVTIQTHNYPSNQTFTVRMGEMGTRGVGGVVVGSLDSGAGGSLSATFNIPDSLKGRAKISIRLDSSQGFYSFNWFYNNTSGSGTGSDPVYTGIPTFTITDVKVDESVSIRTNNFPANQTFTVTMGQIYTRGINGIVVGTLESNEGGVLTAVFDIPEALHGQARIAIRAQTAHANPYFAYNWFYNNTAGDGGSDDGGTGGGTGYTGIPTFKICAVEKDTSITLQTNNFPANQTFAVTMGSIYTRGIGGINVGTIESGAGGTFRATFTIPEGLRGLSRISIRAQTAHANPFFAYNWFYNNSTTADHCGG